MSSTKELVIEPGKSVRNYWRDIWRYRELFYFMAWRDVLLRYKQMTIGFAWAILRPVLTMLVFTLIFSRIAKLPSGGVPYPALVYAAMLPWQFFATAFADAGNSLTNKETIITKVYFPRLIVPASAVIVSFADFLVAGSLLAPLLAWYKLVPGWPLLALPGFIAMALVFSLGAGLWISALSVKYKDFRYVVPFVVQLGLYLSPVGFSASLIPENWRLVYAMNPMVGVIEGFRWSLLGVWSEGLELDAAVSVSIGLILLLSGIAYFRRVERSLAELL
jgi:lipopolysaccharide transport system permease protein